MSAAGPFKCESAKGIKVNKLLDYMFKKRLCTSIRGHSIAMGTLDKSKETSPTTTTALKVAP